MQEVKPYSHSTEDKKTQVKSMFDKIAPAYDVLNSILTLGIDQSWRKKAIDLIPTHQASIKILDVATGTADMAILAAQRNPDSFITGVDLSNGMLKVGHERINKKNLQNQIKLVSGDSENLQFTDNEFDVVMASFGIRNFENLDKGLQEMQRVTKPGGKVILLEFSKPKAFPFKQLFQFYFKYILPLIGKIGSKDQNAYKYLYESVQQFPDYERLASRLTQAGFKNCRYQSLSLGICCLYIAEK